MIVNFGFIDGVRPGRRAVYVAQVAACVIFPFAVFGCTSKDENGTCDDGCFNVVEYAKDKNWDSANACNSCVIACVGDLIKVAAVISGWQQDAKDGKFDHVNNSFDYAFARGYDDFMEYCEWVVNKGSTKTYADDTYARMMRATTNCEGDLEEWIADPAKLCNYQFELMTNTPDQADGILEAFAPFFDLGMTKDADEYDFGSSADGTTDAQAYANYQALSSGQCESYCNSIVSNSDRQFGCANGCKYVKGDSSAKSCNNLGNDKKICACKESRDAASDASKFINGVIYLSNC